uniref:Ubiquitin-like protease family profile domain-containing protein n=1 Tax=Chromera velia CCMP2878 TaxID=1169474 RepID=A0A0G4H9T2_9ALVE|eukprot:Cvel_6023.t1-p1 / transcript=Cvel_6023.t1 / gene=Cvel_6023 / organism=Chromera_velia_CCMP2878 / gene_product=hypothetical protein / transcript_product=hypothetical protein / location=Cvel_scaffold288:91220-95172(+) / protein_length=777 / sequence_SO=supercontig / SO=protein_coding / is_pseudo=false
MDTEPGEVPVGVISSGGTGSSLETVGESGPARCAPGPSQTATRRFPPPVILIPHVLPPPPPPNPPAVRSTPGRPANNISQNPPALPSHDLVAICSILNSSVGHSGYGPVDRLVSELRELRLGWASMKEGGEFWGDFHINDQLMEAGALSALIEDRPNMRGPVGDRNVFVTSSRIYSVLRAVVGDDAPTFPDVESRREFLSVALGGRVEFLGETALRAKFCALELGLLLTACLNVQCPRTRSNEAPQSPLCLGPTESDVMCNLPPFPTLQAPQSGRHRRPGGGSTETKGFGGEIQSGRTAEIAILGRTGGVMGRELDAVKERFLMALHEREEVDRMLRECARDLSTSLSILGRERPQSLQMAGVAVPALIPRPSKKRAVSAVAATTEHIQAPVCDPPTVSSGYANGAGAPVLTNGDAAITRAEHLVLSALRIAEAKESAMATAGKLPDLSVPDPSPGSAALGVMVSARSPLLCPRSAGCTTKIVAQGESLAESATRMAIEEEMIESEQEEGLMGWLGSYQSGHSIDSDGLARLAPGRWLNDSAMNFFGRVITFLGAEFESSPPLTFVNSVATEMMKLIDIEAMQRTKKAADWQVERERGKATGGSTGSRNVDTKWKEREADLRSWWVHRLRRMGKRFKPYGGKDLFCVFNHSDAHWLAGYVKGGEKGAMKENETLPMLTVYTLDSLPPTQISIPGLLYPFFKATACGDDLIGGDDDIPMQAYALTVPCQRNGYDCGPHVLGWLIAMITGMDFQEVNHAVAARVRVALRNVVTYVSEEP